MLNRANTRARAALAWAAFSAALMVSSAALAQSASGRIQGKVVDAVSTKPLADVVITATSPALQGEQTVVTDQAGEFEIPTLPPGTYLLHLEKEGYRPLNQPDLVVRLDKTVRVNLPIVPESVKAEEIVIVGKAPTVDVGTTQTGATITNDFINNLPIAPPGGSGSAVRSFESLQATAPGATEDLYGVSVAGTTSPENNYVIDGVVANDPAFGLNGSSLAVDFVKEVDVITGGYLPEYGRATGGVTNVITKSGGNEFHGSLALYAQPGFLTAPAKEVIQSGQSLSVSRTTSLNSNLVAEVGGPIVKDKLWFYVGFSPTVTFTEMTRRVNVVTYQKGCPVDADGNPVASSSDPAFSRFSADATGCAASTKGVATDPAGGAVVDQTTPVESSKRLYHHDNLQYQYMAKLTYLLNQDQRFTGSVWGNPGVATGPSAGSSLQGSLSSLDARNDFNTNDYSLRWDGSFFDKHMLTEAVLGWHHQYSHTEPGDPSVANQPGFWYIYPRSLVDFEPEAAQYCGANDPNETYKTCPVQGYTVGGPGFNFALETTKLDSWQGRIAAANLFRAAGHHEVKYGIDYLLEQYDHNFAYSGGVAFRERSGSNPYNKSPAYPNGRQWSDFRRFGYLAGPDDPVFQDGVHNVTKSTSLAGFIQDQYRILDLVNLNIGVRWENQQLIGGDGNTVISLPNNIQPRVGLIYDFTQQGRSKLFANYGLYYEQVPIDMLDRNFPVQTTIYTRRKCDANAPLDSAHGCENPATIATDTAKDPAETSQHWRENGGAAEPVDPHLKGQSSTEIVAGGEYEVIPDGRVGATFTHRNLNSVIEDVSNDGANTYFIANPGEGIAKDFPRATRNYNAFTLYFDKSLSHRWMVTASYTLSRLTGNYSGLFRPDDGQLDPNINADFDLKQFLLNADGPLPGDHTHNVKVYGAYDIPTGKSSDVVVGLTYNGLSGSPTNYLGIDQVYGQPLSFILPRGSGPRLPWIHEVDAALRYNQRITEGSVLTVSADIFNLLDLREVTGIDQTYTQDTVLPVPNGTLADLNNLKNTDGTKATKSATYGQPTSYQAPLSVRLGLKLTF